MIHNNQKYKSSVQLIDSAVLAKEISKAILFREYADKLNREFYQLDHNGVEKINADGEKIYTDKAVYILFQLYIYYLGIIQEHKEPLPTALLFEEEQEQEEEPPQKDPNIIIKWIRDILNFF